MVTIVTGIMEHGYHSYRDMEHMVTIVTGIWSMATIVTGM